MPDPRKLARSLNSFAKADTGRSIAELLLTLAGYAATFAAMLFAVSAGYYAALALVPLAGLFLLRLFIIQHDCGHGSYFAKTRWSDRLGRALGVLTLTPYDCWAHAHKLHHAGTGNLDARGYGDVDTLTVEEYRDAGFWGRLGYRTYRHPLVLLGLGPAYLFLLRHRLPIGFMRAGWSYWISALGTDLAILGLLTALSLVFGFGTTMLVFLPTLLTAAGMGVALFYVQHQFEHAMWDRKGNWTFHDAALGGSTYLALPAPIAWFTGYIGIHHVHHLASRIPFYKLPKTLDAHPELRQFNRLSLREAWESITLALWDENKRRLVSFREAGFSRRPA